MSNHIPETFTKQLEHLLNYHGIDNLAQTPDFILADYMVGQLLSFILLTKQREQWHGRGTQTESIEVES